MFEDKKEYLSNYMLIEAKIKRLKSQIILNPDNKEIYENDILTLKNLRNNIENNIKNIDNGVLSEILFQKFICGKSIMQISYILNFSKRHIERLYDKALENLNIK